MKFKKIIKNLLNKTSTLVSKLSRIQIAVDYVLLR